MPSMRVRGITIEINADMTGFVKNFKKSDKQIKDLKKQLTDVDRLIKRDDFWAFKKNRGEAVDLLRQKQKYLGEEIIATKAKIADEEAALIKLGNSDPTPENIKLQEALQRELYNDKLALEGLEKQQKEFGSVGKQIWLGYAQGIGAAGEKLEELGSKMINTGTQLTMKVTTPIVAAGTAIVNSAMDFESAMAKVRSVTQDASDDQIAALESLALELSTTTKYSATEAADALYYMGLAGWDATEMMRALPDVLNLAAAGDMELGQASDIVTDFVTAFGLTAEDTTRFVDVMAQTMANSNTTIEQMGDAFKYVAPVAGALGFSVEDVALALGIMADNGTKGSRAGTSLRQLMQRLAKPTAEVAAAMEQLGISLEDESGNAYSFREILDKLRSSLNLTDTEIQQMAEGVAQLDEAYENGEMSEEEYNEALESLMESIGGVTGAEKAKSAAILAGTRGMSGLLAVINATTEDYEGLANKIGDSKDAAKDIADIMMNTTQGSFLKMKRSVEQLGISIGKMLLPYVNSGIEKIKEWVEKIKNTDEETVKLVLKIAALAAAIGPVITLVGGLVTAGGKILTLVSTLMTHPLITAVGLLGAGIAALVVSVKNSVDATKEAAEAEYGLDEAEKVLIERINGRAQAYEDLQTERDNYLASTETELTTYEGLLTELDKITDANGTIQEGYKARADYIVNELSEAFGIEIQMNDGIISKYQEVRDAILDIIEAKRTESILSAYQEEYEAALAGSSQAAIDLALAQDTLIKRSNEAAEAQEAYNEANANYAKAVNNPQYQQALRQAKENLEAATAAENEASEAVKTAQETYSDYMTTIQNYEGVMTAVASGDVNNLNGAIAKLTSGFKTATTATREELAKQLEEFQSQYGAMKRAVEEGMPGVTQEQVEQMHRLVIAAQAELDGADDGFREKGAKWVKEMGDGMEGNTSHVKKAATTVKEAVLAGLEDLSPYTTGKNFVVGFADGISDNEHFATNAAMLLATHTMDEFNVALGVESPSKKTMKTGGYFTEGFALGIEKDSPKAIDAASNLAKDAMSAMNAKGFADVPYMGQQTNNTYGAINVTINAANVQNDAALANMVADKINREVLRRRAAYT